MPDDPFTDSNNLSIRLIRDKIENDDKITIKKVSSDIYLLYYTHSSKKDEKQITILDKEQALSYIESLFFLVCQDITAFRFLQLNIPCMPLLLLSVERLKNKKAKNTVETVCKLFISKKE